MNKIIIGILVIICMIIATVKADSCSCLNAVQEIKTIGSLPKEVESKYASVPRKQVKSFLETAQVIEEEEKYSDQLVVTEYLVKKKDSDSTIGDYVTLTTLNLTTTNYNSFGNPIGDNGISFSDKSPVRNYVSMCSFADMVEENAAIQSGYAVVNALDEHNRAVLMVLEKQTKEESGDIQFVEHSTIELSKMGLSEDKFDEDMNITPVPMSLEIQMDIGSSSRQIQTVVTGKTEDILELTVVIYSKSSKIFNIEYDLSKKEAHLKNKAQMIVPEISKVPSSVIDGGKFTGTLKVLNAVIVVSASVSEAEFNVIKNYFIKEERPTYPAGVTRAPFLIVLNRADLSPRAIILAGSEPLTSNDGPTSLTLSDFDIVNGTLMLVANSIPPSGKNVPVKMSKSNTAVLETYKMGTNFVGALETSKTFIKMEDIRTLASEHVQKLFSNDDRLNVRLSHISKSNYNTFVVAATFIFDYEKPLDHKTNFVNLDPADLDFEKSTKLEVQKDGNDMVLDLRPRVAGKKLSEEKSIRSGVVAAILVEGTSTEFVPEDYIYATSSLPNKGVLWDIDCEGPNKTLTLTLNIICLVVFIITSIIIAIMIVSCGSLLLVDIIKSLSKRFSKNAEEEIDDSETKRLVGNEN